MAGNVSAYIKSYQQNNKATVDAIFDQLEQYREFCVNYGYAYNPAHLNKENNGTYKEFVKLQRGREPRNRWIEDAKKFSGNND